MTIQIKIFHANKMLKNEFITASGCLKEKEILMVIFYINELPTFLYELPLSPSLGEMPRDILTILDRKKIQAFNLSPHLKRACSYFFGLALHDFRSEFYCPLYSLKMCTYSLHEWPEQEDNHIFRLKCNAKNLNQLILYSKRINSQWTVDFNGSLNKELFLCFLQKANFKNCLWIEQPLKSGELSHSLAKNSRIPIYADEDVTFMRPENFIESPYKGLMLKPIRHDFPEFLKWLQFAHRFKIPCLIGNQICDVVSSSFCRFFNRLSTVEVIFENTSSCLQGADFHEEIFYNEQNMMKINKNIFHYIEKNYDMTYAFEFAGENVILELIA